MAISCQKVLVRIDPELKHGNHYHNLACFLACNGNIEEADKAFISGLMHRNTKITSELYVEYAQFLFMNKASESLSIDNNIISKYLYNAINCDNVGGVQYGKMEKNTICNVLQNLIKAKNTTIEVNPKILSYYLLTSNPEYIREEDNIENLIKSLRELCETVYDEVSFKILADAYSSIDNNELSTRYSEYSKVLGKLEDIIAGKALLESNKDILTSDVVQEIGDFCPSPLKGTLRNFPLSLPL